MNIRIGIFLLTTTLFSAAAHAQILLKPNGGNAAPLRVKALKADVKISGQFAQTQLNYVFQNETSSRIEADFIYTVPQNATVTYFAYWFGEEKVVARVVEKERAAQIYHHITSRMRDPALVEMIGKNTFRARIFPVMPNADLKVEIHTVQVLPSDKTGAFYTLALRGPEAGKGTFEQLDVQVAGVLDKAFSGVGNNFNLPMKTDGAKFDFTLSQSNYRAPRDLKITLKPRDADLRAVAFAKSAGGENGFFALALSPGEALRRPRISISGVKTSEIAPRKLPAVGAHGTLLVTGRYRGSGTATVLLSDGARSWKTSVSLSNSVEANHLATKLWAARRIEDLSGSATNQQAVMALSKRFTLPSRWTSWPAIPKEELERFKQEKAATDRDYYGRLLAVEFAQGRGRGSRARQLRTSFDAASRTLGEKPADALKAWAVGRLSYLQYEVENSRGNVRTKLVAEIRGLARLAGVKASDYLNRRRMQSRQERIRESQRARANIIASSLAQELLKRGKTQRAKKLDDKLERQTGLSGDWAPGLLAKHLNGPAHRLAVELARERMRQTMDVKRIAQLNQKLDMLMLYCNGNISYFISSAEAEVLGDLSADAIELVQLRHSEKPDKKRLNELEAHFAKYKGRLTLPEATIRKATYAWANEQMHRAAWLLADEKVQPNPDQGKLAALRHKFEKAAQEDPQAPLSESARLTYWQRFHDLARQLNRRVDNDDLRSHSEVLTELRSALSENKLDSDKVRSLQAKFTQLHTKLESVVPNPLESSDMQADIAELQNMPTLLQSARAKADHHKVVQLEKRREELLSHIDGLFRPGDPLISIEAPADSQQVIALLPDGVVKTLAFNAQSGRWEARFDIPTYAPEGEFPITVVIVGKDGVRRTLKLNFRVDGTAPRGIGSAATVDGGKLRLELEADSDTARVAALLPWGAKVDLKPSTQRAHGFFALAEIPPAFRGAALQITYVVTDRAHNRTTVTVDTGE